MTDEELIAQARELCEKKVAFYVAPELGKHAKENQIAWTTHLAEMDEHHVGINEGENHCWKDLDEYPCNFLVTKAKRLLGDSK